MLYHYIALLGAGVCFSCGLKALCINGIFSNDNYFSADDNEINSL